MLDLASAHLLAAQRLLAGDRGDVYNLGTGNGTTVREIIDAIEAVTGLPVPHSEAPRRPGDPPALYASSEKIRADLGWEPTWTDIASIIETAASWSKNPRY